MRGIVVGILACALAAGTAPAQNTGTGAGGPADLIVTAARIYTVDADRPVVRAVAVRGGLVAFAGSVREAMALKGPRTRVLDLGDATVIPGIIDAHAHLDFRRGDAKVQRAGRHGTFPPLRSTPDGI